MSIYLTGDTHGGIARFRDYIICKRCYSTSLYMYISAEYLKRSPSNTRLIVFHLQKNTGIYEFHA